MAGFGANLKAARKRKGLTQAELAEKVGLGENTLARWERDELIPSDPLQLIRLAALLGTSVEALFGKAERAADDLAYRAGVLDTARLLKELVQELEQGGPSVNARLLNAGQHSRKRVRLDGVKQIGKKVNRSLKIRGRPDLDGLPKE